MAKSDIKKILDHFNNLLKKIDFLKKKAYIIKVCAYIYNDSNYNLLMFGLINPNIPN